MKKVVLSVICAVALMMGSCSVVSTGAGSGFIYTDVTEGAIATGNQCGTKVGESQAVGVLGIVAIGDASIQTAAHQAGIKKISHVDTKKMSILGIFSKYTTVVYGE